MFRPTRDKRKFEMSARRILLRGLKEQVTYLNETLVPRITSVFPDYTTDTDPTLDPIFAELKNAFDGIAGRMVRGMDALHRTQQSDHTGQWIDNVKATVGIDISNAIDGPLDKTMRLWSSNTASLINGVTDDMVKGISRATVETLTQGGSHAQLAKRLKQIYAEELHGKHLGRTVESRKRTQASKKLAYRRMSTQPGFKGTGRPGKYWNRYEIIARDQVTTLRSHLDRVRQQEAGITSYKWKDADDSRVRKEHAARDGVVFSWDTPPSDGHPGEPILCRCQALAVMVFD